MPARVRRHQLTNVVSSLLRLILLRMIVATGTLSYPIIHLNVLVHIATERLLNMTMPADSDIRAQDLQVDVCNGYRRLIRTIVKDCETINGIKFGYVKMDGNDFLLVRQLTCGEWIFCDEKGNRVHRESSRINHDTREADRRRQERELYERS